MKAIRDLLRTDRFIPIKESAVKEMLKNGVSLGVSTARFLPKSDSLRTITNMRRNPTQPENLSMKYKLMDLFDVLNSIKNANPALLGSAVSCSDDIYRKWRQFLNSRLESQDERQLYFCKVDVKRCFDSIRHDMLLDIVTECVEQSSKDFILTKCAILYSEKGRPRCKFQTFAEGLRECKFLSHIYSMIRTKKLHDVIVVDLAKSKFLDATTLLPNLRSHVEFNIIKLNSR
ncbi:hypothetical protein Ahia01_001061800, partial [Argonauta hians]